MNLPKVFYYVLIITSSFTLTFNACIFQKQKTGLIEVNATNLKVFNLAKKLPIYVKNFNKSNESHRLKYRYLDLRHERMQYNLRLRSKIIHKMRKFLIENLNFVEVETPTLFKKTPGVCKFS